MKLLLAVYIAFISTPATLHEGRCSACERWKVQSEVRMEMWITSTAMACGPGRYLKDGGYIPPVPCNTATQYGKCSNGHTVVTSWKQ